MRKLIILLIGLALMVGSVLGVVLDYDTFDRDGQPLGMTEGLNNSYGDMSGYEGSLDEVSIANGMAIFNETVGVGYWIYVNQSTSPLNEYTFYMKMKSSLATEYIELIGQEAPHDVGGTDSIMSVEGDSVYHFIGQTTTLDSDEWVEMYYYRDGSIHNVTVVGESGTFTYSGAFVRNPFGVWNFYWDSSGGTEAKVLIDEWAICSGYDLTCSPPSEILPPTGEVTWSPDYTADDLAPSIFDAIGRIILTLVAFAGIITIVLVGSWGIAKIKGKR